MKTIMIYFLLFILYSFCGWIIEIISTTIDNKKIVNRGFLIGPYCPIYGAGALLALLVLKPYHQDLLILFVMTTVICSILEYITSYIMEKLFKARWWDYSHIPFNINGRICLLFAIGFGLGGVIVTFVNPYIYSWISSWPTLVLAIIFGILLSAFTIDLIVSFNIINKLKLTVKNVRKDNSEEISEKVKKMLAEKSYQFKRLLQAFPNIKILETTTKKFFFKNNKK